MSILIQFKQEQVDGKITTQVWSTGLQNTVAKQGCNPPNTTLLVKETECSLLHLFELVQNMSTSWLDFCLHHALTSGTPTTRRSWSCGSGRCIPCFKKAPPKATYLDLSHVADNEGNKWKKQNTNKRSHSKCYIFVWDCLGRIGDLEHQALHNLDGKNKKAGLSCKKVTCVWSRWRGLASWTAPRSV